MQLNCTEMLDEQACNDDALNDMPELSKDYSRVHKVEKALSEIILKNGTRCSYYYKSAELKIIFHISQPKHVMGTQKNPLYEHPKHVYMKIEWLGKIQFYA